MKDLITFLQDCKASGVTYRDNFKPDWDKCQKQIRCVPPEYWNKKADWQTKIYIPMQAKKSEIAKSFLNKMIFGKKVNFDIRGVEIDDKDNAQQLTNLIATLFNLGDFDIQNEFVLQEAVDIGTAFIKLIIKDDRTIDFVWRSAYNVVFDPNCGHNIDNARWLVDLYRRDINYVLDEAKKGRFKNVDKFLADVSKENSQSQMVVKSIDGTEDITIPSQYKMVDVDEYWVSVPNEKGKYEDRKIIVLNSKYILSNVENPFGFIPFQWCRVKPRKYDSYGKGYIDNTRGLQDLMNSCVNLGFDSLKISSMDIIVIDDNKVKDSTTIKYKPLAVWKMKDINGVKIQRQPISAISDVLRGLTMIDQIDQDASGITRQAQGSPNLSGSGTSAETLGEYQLKLQMINQRFLDVGRFIEKDYFIPLIKKVFKIITNPKLFTQELVNKLLGMRKVDDLQIINGQAQVVGTKKIPKLNLEDIRGKGEMGFNFFAVGLTQFTGKLEEIAKLKEALQAALSNPTLTALTKIDLLWKKLWQASDIDDYQDILRSPQEARELLGLKEGQNAS